jgi:hypothetical protein
MTPLGPDTPYHLAPLTEGTPLSIEKLKAAWPGLSFADKISLIRILLGESGKDIGLLKWKRHRNSVRNLGLADANDFVRYFTALTINEEDEGEEAVPLRQRVLHDSSSLVHSALDQWTPSFFSPSETPKHYEEFWALPVPRRLTLTNDMDDSEIANRLRYAVNELLPKDCVTTADLEDVVHEYVEGRRRNSTRIKRFDELWHLVPDLPIKLSLLVVHTLPRLSDVSQALLDRFNDDQLQVLLARDDIRLPELRRKLYRSAQKEGLLHASVSSSQYVIQEEEISEIFASGKAVAAQAVALTQSAKGATLVQKQALRWIIAKCDLDPAWVQFMAEKHLRARSEKLTAKSLENEVLQMRLFELARVLTIAAADGLDSVRSQYSGDSDHLEARAKEYLSLVVDGNPWETYLKLRLGIRDANALRKVLPSADDERYLDTKQLPADLRA